MRVTRVGCGPESANRQSAIVNRQLVCGSSSVGRALPCQGRGRGFKSRLPLLHGRLPNDECRVTDSAANRKSSFPEWRLSQAVRQRSAKPLHSGANPEAAFPRGRGNLKLQTPNSKLQTAGRPSRRHGACAPGVTRREPRLRSLTSAIYNLQSAIGSVLCCRGGGTGRRQGLKIP